MNMRRWSLVVVFLMCGAAFRAFAQSNEVLDQLLDQEQATLALTAYLVLSAADIVGEDASVEGAFEELRQKPWGFQSAGPDDPVDLGTCALLVMKSFGMHGGIMYSLFPGKRYAARELAFRGAVVGRTGPSLPLSGRAVVDIVGRVLDLLGQRESAEVTE